MFIRPVVSEGGQTTQDTTNCFSLVLEPVRCKYLQGSDLFVDVLVNRKTGPGNLQSLKFIFNSGEQTITREINQTISEYETKRFVFDDLEITPAFVTLAGRLGSGQQSCDEVRPPISCQLARCGDGEVDAGLGEVCDGGCCRTDCTEVIATCNRVDDDEDGSTDEPGEQLPASFNIAIASPVSITYQTVSNPWNGLLLNFSVINLSAPSQIFSFSSCWYVLDSGSQNIIPNCNQGGVSETYSAQLSLAPGAHTIQVYANDTANRLAQKTVSFTVVLGTVQLTSPLVLPDIMRNNSIPLSFITTLTGLQNCSYTFNGGQINSSIPGCQTTGTTFSIPEGYHNITLSINNTAGLRTNHTVEFLAVPCRGDVNGDGTANFADYTTFLSNWGCEDSCGFMINNPQYRMGDLNRDGQVDLRDHQAIIRYLQTC